MPDIKLAVIYYSSTGANHQLSQWAAEGGEQAGAEVKLLRVAETAPQAAIDANPAWKANIEATASITTATVDDLEWADAIIFSSPTRYGHITSQFQSFLDTTGGLWSKGVLANKVVSAMASASTAHGGQETTIQAFYTTMLHWGAIIVSPGYTDPIIFKTGNPYGTSATVDQSGKIQIQEDIREAVIHQAKRTVMVAKWVKAGLAG